MSVKCECGKEHTDWVPAARLSQVVQQRKDAEGKVTELTGTVSTLTAQVTASEGLSSQLQEVTAELSAAQTRGAIMQAGIVDAEGIDVVVALWNAKPEDARPPEGLAGWLTSPDSLPRAVRAYLPQEVPPAPPAGAPPAPPVPGAPPAPAALPAAPAGHRPPGTNGVVTTPPGAQTMTSEAIRGMSPAEYAAFRAGGGVQSFKASR